MIDYETGVKILRLDGIPDNPQSDYKHDMYYRLNWYLHACKDHPEKWEIFWLDLILMRAGIWDLFDPWGDLYGKDNTFQEDTAGIIFDENPDYNIWLETLGRHALIEFDPEHPEKLRFWYSRKDSGIWSPNEDRSKALCLGNLSAEEGYALIKMLE